MLKQVDCKNCTWCDYFAKSAYCNLYKRVLAKDDLGKIEPPSDCHRTIKSKAK